MVGSRARKGARVAGGALREDEKKADRERGVERGAGRGPRARAIYGSTETGGAGRLHYDVDDDDYYYYYYGGGRRSFADEE